MSLFRPKPSALAEWYDVVMEAQAHTGYCFDDYLQHYLVLTLDHFTTHGDLTSCNIALNFLEGFQSNTRCGAPQLRDVGDHCLILAGLFPERALKKNVSLNYFIGMGRYSYYLLSSIDPKFAYDAQLFEDLSTNFVGLMDVLHYMRKLERDIF